MAKPMFTLDVAGDTQMARGFSRLGDSIKDLRPAFKEIVKSFRTIMKKQFESEGGYSGDKWAPLSPTYAVWKAENFGGQPILQLTGLLADSLTSKTPYTVEEIDKKSLVIGTKLAYGTYHQTGTGRMPARPIINLTEQDKMTWMKIFQKFIMKEAKEAGLR